MIQTIITWDRELYRSSVYTDTLARRSEFYKYMVAKDTDDSFTVTSIAVVDPITNITKYADTITRVWTNIDSARAWVEFIKTYGTISAEVIET